jgi:hypothetical protein
MRRLLLAGLLLLAACNRSATTTTETTAPTTTSTTTTSTTTTTTPENVSPLNGLPVDDPLLLDRRVLAVKIDNHPSARPQSGIEHADAVIELPVEGITRFIALFLSQDTDYLGPVRSGRPSDGKLLHPLGATFAISGGQAWVLESIGEEGVHLIGETPPAMFRIRERRAPHNLYADTEQLRAIADQRDYPDDPPPSLFEFGPLPAGAAPARQLVANFGGTFRVTWDWNPTDRVYERSFGGAPAELVDREGVTSPLTAQTLVVLLAERYLEEAPPGQTSVPAMNTVGEGTAYVFAGGRMIEGTWRRETSADLITLTDEEGEPLPVPPGHLWISIVPVQTGIEFR